MEKQSIKKHLLCLMACCLLLSSCSHIQAPTDKVSAPPDNLTSEQRRYYRWGEDVVLAATYPYGWYNTHKYESIGYSESYEGVMFPVYVGYLSFDDQGEQKMVYFTPSDMINIRFLEARCERINRSREISYPHFDISIDDPDFCWGMWFSLNSLHIYEVIRLPLGTAQNYDFAFKKQTEFRYAEADRRLGEFGKPRGEWGISKDNLLMTPKK